MHATIQRYAQVAGTPDEVAHAGRQLASVLSAQPGFLSWVLVQGPEGGIVAIGLCEDEPSSRQLSRIAARWLAEHLDGASADQSTNIIGEVMAQRGL